MSYASISEFDWRFLNQQRQISECDFRLFDLSKYLTTRRSNFSPCQKAITLILIFPFIIDHFIFENHQKKSLGTAVFLCWMPLKNLRLWLVSLNYTYQAILALAGHLTNQPALLPLYTRWLIKKAKICETPSIFFVGMENLTFRGMHVGEKSMGKSLRFFLLSFITLEIS